MYYVSLHIYVHIYIYTFLRTSYINANMYLICMSLQISLRIQKTLVCAMVPAFLTDAMQGSPAYCEAGMSFILNDALRSSAFRGSGSKADTR